MVVGGGSHNQFGFPPNNNAQDSRFQPAPWNDPYATKNTKTPSNITKHILVTFEKYCVLDCSAVRSQGNNSERSFDRPPSSGGKGGKKKDKQ